MLATPVSPLLQAATPSAAASPKPTSTPTPPQTATSVLGSMRRLSIHGVKPSAQQEPSKAPDLPEYGEQASVGIAPEALQQQWADYLHQLKVHRLSLYATLKEAHVTVMNDGRTVQFTIRSSIQEKAFASIQNHVRGYLRYKFQRADIELRVVLDPTLEASMAVATREAYFQKLLEENPALKALVQEYGGRLA